MKLSLRFLVPFFAVLTLICCGLGILTGSGVRDTIETTIFILLAVFILIVLPVAWLCRRRSWLRNLRLRRPPPFSDPQLGQLRFSFGFAACLWRGSIAILPGASVPLAIAGSADGPDPVALAAAKNLAANFFSLQQTINEELFRHYEPHAEAIASGELKLCEPLQAISKPSDIWPLIKWDSVEVTPMGRILVTEVRLMVPWDEEHTLGLRFEGSRLVELNGSV